MKLVVFVLVGVGCNQEPTTLRGQAEQAQEDLAVARKQAAEMIADSEEDAVDEIADAKEDLQETKQEAHKIVHDPKNGSGQSQDKGERSAS